MFCLMQFCLIYRVTNETFIYCAVIFYVECFGMQDSYYDYYHLCSSFYECYFY